MRRTAITGNLPRCVFTDLERQAWIAGATCVEERVPMSPERRMEYALSDRRAQFRIAAENSAKMTRVAELIKSHPGASILIIGEYVTQIQSIARQFNLPLVTGKTPQTMREEI